MRFSVFVPVTLITLTLAGCLEAGETSVELGQEFALVPTISIGPDQSTPTNSGTVTYLASFSSSIEAASFTASDIENLGTASGVVWSEPEDLTGQGLKFAFHTTQVGADGTVIPFLRPEAVRDLKGNLSAGSLSGGSLAVLVDREKPSAPTLLEIAADDDTFSSPVSQSFATRTPRLQWAESVDTLSGIKSYQIQVYRKDDKFLLMDWSPITFISNSVPYPNWPLTNPTNLGIQLQIRMRAVDNAGNTSEVVEGPSWYNNIENWQRLFAEGVETHFGTSMAMSENWAAVSVINHPSLGVFDYNLALYQKTNGRWSRSQVLVNASSNSTMLAISENKLLVSDGAYAVALYTLDSGSSTWSKAADLPLPPTTQTPFITGLALMGDKVVIGRTEISYTYEEWSDSYTETSSGHILVFGNHDGSWVEDGRLTPATSLDGYAISIESRDDRLMASIRKGQTFEAHFWKLEGDEWLPQGHLLDMGTFSSTSFDKDRLAVIHEDGLFEIYARSPISNTWSLESSRGYGDTLLQAPILLTGNKLLGTLGNTNKLVELEWNGSDWKPAFTYLPADSNLGDQFPRMLAGNTTGFMVSAPTWGFKESEEIGLLNPGAVYYGQY